ncbi:MAG: hypothetical protein ACK52I_27395 [Pseudomonadota bacterium]
MRGAWNSGGTTGRRAPAARVPPRAAATPPRTRAALRDGANEPY